MFAEYIPWPLSAGASTPVAGFSGLGAWYNNTFASVAGFRIPNWLGLGAVALAGYWFAKKQGWIKKSNRGRRRGRGRRRNGRLDDLKALLPSGWIVRTWSPGDGVTRYRFFRNAPVGQSYFGPANGEYTAFGYKQAMAFAGGLAR